MDPLRRAARRRSRLVLPALAALLLAAPATTQAFDSAPHTDMTHDAMIAEGFGGTATDVSVVNNWLVDLYFNSKKIPQSGHAGLKIEIIGSLLGPRENWSKQITDGAERMHFDASVWDVFNVRQAQREFERLQRATTKAIRAIKTDGRPRREARLLAVIGITLH